MKLSSFAPLVLVARIVAASSSSSSDSSSGSSSDSLGHDPIPPGPLDATCLYQADFDDGTYIISTPGSYKLCEDVTFNPNAPAPGELPKEDAFDPTFGGEYPPNEFGLGFFSALSIASSDVIFHLNGFAIDQSPGHALMQRFFAVIELASSPFIPSVGPAQFVSQDGAAFAPASNVEIHGPGIIGRSSHHGIHGNDNTNVKITGVEFRDFEVAAVSLNNVDSLEISNCDIVKNRHDVPVVGMFSAARFIRPYGKYLKEQQYQMDLYDAESGQIQVKTAAEVYDNLIASINNVYEDVILGNGQIDAATHPEEHHLFSNPFEVVDGPCYAFVVHGRGPAVGGQGEIFNEADDTVTSSNVTIVDNRINDITCWNNEVPALVGSCGGHGCVVNDARGAVFQTIKTFDSESPHLALGPDGRYNSNVVADMQIMVAKAILDGTLTNIPSRQTGPNSINQGIVDWASLGTVMTPQYICNGDSMHHVIKGIIAIRVEDTAGFSIENNILTNIDNLSVPPFTNCDGFHIGASSENADEFQAGNVRVISVAAVRGFGDGARSVIKKNQIGGIYSDEANVIVGIDVQGDSEKISIKKNLIDLQEENIFDGYEAIGIRVREAVDGSISIVNNDVDEEVQVLNANGVRGRSLKRAHAHVSGDIEWKAGGCPFAAEYASRGV